MAAACRTFARLTKQCGKICRNRRILAPSINILARSYCENVGTKTWQIIQCEESVNVRSVTYGWTFALNYVRTFPAFVLRTASEVRNMVLYIDLNIINWFLLKLLMGCFCAQFSLVGFRVELCGFSNFCIWVEIRNIFVCL